MLNIKPKFNALIKKSTKKVDEILLFRTLSEVLNNEKINNCYINVCETHQKKVAFKSKYRAKEKEIEISDLLIISYKKTEINTFKITFLQNKYNKKLNPFNHSKFYANKFQFELLSKRPKLKSLSKTMKFPDEILSFASQDSIGSYGIFYNKHGAYNMSYSIANKILPINKTKRRINSNLNCSFQLKLEKNLNKFGELVSTFEINTFLQSLINGQIGAKVDIKNNSHLEIARVIYNALNFAVAEKPSTAHLQNIKGLIETLKSNEPNLFDDSDELKMLCNNILIIEREN